MLDYKRLTFVFFFLIIFLLSTDSQTERQIRKSLLSFFNIVVEEGSQVSDTAPGSLLDTAENIRLGTASFLEKQGQTLAQKSEKYTGITSFAFGIASYIILLFKFITYYVITFYPFVLFLLYMFFTSRFFRRNEFGYDNF